MIITNKSIGCFNTLFNRHTKKVDTTMNSKKVNTMLTVTDVYKLFTDAVNGRVCKLNFSDAKSQPYCGYDDFSVNMKKTTYNVYMNNVNRDICIGIDNKLTASHNDCDTTKKQLRCNLIKFDNIETLKKCIVAVTNNRFATN